MEVFGSEFSFFSKTKMYSSLFSAEQGYMYVVPDFALYGMIISIGIILMILLRYHVFSRAENHGNEKKKILMAYLIRFLRKFELLLLNVTAILSAIRWSFC